MMTKCINTKVRSGWSWMEIDEWMEMDGWSWMDGWMDGVGWIGWTK